MFIPQKLSVFLLSSLLRNMYNTIQEQICWTFCQIHHYMRISTRRIFPMHLNEQELEVLSIIENNSRIELLDLAKMTNLSEEEIGSTLKKLEDQRIIVRYSTIINW